MRTQYAIEKLRDYNTKLDNGVRGDVATLISNIENGLSHQERMTGKYIEKYLRLKVEVAGLKKSLDVLRDLS